MKILVTGGAGFIGSHIVDAYLAAGHQVAVLDDLSSGKRENINPRAQFELCDIRSPRADEFITDFKPQIINHHAAQISVPFSVKDPTRDAEVNIVGLIKTLESAVKCGVKKVIFPSTGGTIYGEASVVPTPEEYRADPHSPYTCAKYACERYLAYYRYQHGLVSTILRYGNIYGPRQVPQGEAGVVAIFIQAFQKGATPVLCAYSGEPDGMERDYVYVEDAVRANLLALERGNDQTVNIGWGKGVTTGQVLREVAKSLKAEPKFNRAGPRPGDLHKSAIANRKAQEALGWQPQVNLHDGIQRTADYFKSIR
ncbi:NAD-dependent epimerase/dehydratase family protein [candidate division TA06 bacterium]|uniref:NAD-dependent epimerase/dehydratase family protein n=1 Tax=candidate division TA06 bacterium TaxID=2250710 RepID=A0A933IAA3_UNCT6|nr:NAD-dependent epimerase/dehydratase family protein [candidate division TA06 bacterium]